MTIAEDAPVDIAEAFGKERNAHHYGHVGGDVSIPANRPNHF